MLPRPPLPYLFSVCMRRIQETTVSQISSQSSANFIYVCFVTCSLSPGYFLYLGAWSAESCPYISLPNGQHNLFTHRIVIIIYLYDYYNQIHSFSTGLTSRLISLCLLYIFSCTYQNNLMFNMLKTRSNFVHTHMHMHTQNIMSPTICSIRGMLSH